MSDAPSSSAHIQQEALQTTKPVSEAALFAIGGAINYLLTGGSGRVGDLQASDLTEAQFQTLRDTTWVLCDGRSVVGSAYQSLTGLANIPDRRAVVLRCKDNGRGLDPAGDPAIGTYQVDTLLTHSHTIPAERIQDVQTPDVGTQTPPWPSNPRSNKMVSFLVNNSAPINLDTSVSNAGPGAETRVKSSITNFFIKINT